MEQMFVSLHWWCSGNVWGPQRIPSLRKERRGERGGGGRESLFKHSLLSHTVGSSSDEGCRVRSFRKRSHHSRWEYTLHTTSSCWKKDIQDVARRHGCKKKTTHYYFIPKYDYCTKVRFWTKTWSCRKKCCYFFRDRGSWIWRIVQDTLWCAVFRYLKNIVLKLGTLNASMQGEKDNLMSSNDKIKAKR